MTISSLSLLTRLNAQIEVLKERLPMSARLSLDRFTQLLFEPMLVGLSGIGASKNIFWTSVFLLEFQTISAPYKLISHLLYTWVDAGSSLILFEMRCWYDKSLGLVRCKVYQYNKEGRLKATIRHVWESLPLCLPSLKLNIWEKGANLHGKRGLHF